MLTLPQILKVWKDRALYEGPNVPIPRDHCSQNYYSLSAYEKIKLRESKSRESQGSTVTSCLDNLASYDDNKDL